MTKVVQEKWSSLSPEEIFQELHTSTEGLSFEEAKKRQDAYGKNILVRKKHNLFLIFLRQFTSNPLIIILALATTISYALGEHTSSYYIFGIILVSVGLGLWNEFSAEKTVENLLKKVTSFAHVIRRSIHQEIPTSDVTVGDIIVLSQGDIVPADARLIAVKDLEMNESSLTGESISVFKSLELSKDSSNNTLVFMGTSVQNGWAQAIVVAIGDRTVFGSIAKDVAFIKPITQFQRGLMEFGSLIIKVIAIFTIGIFVINALLGHSLLESLLFSLAIAVGLTPELLPVIVTISLSHGAGKLAKKHVVAKQLIAIENLGNMDILCTDKTGTLTEGIIHVTESKNTQMEHSHEVFMLALEAIDKTLHSKANAIDEAIQQYGKIHNITAHVEVLDREPFNFDKKALYFVKSAGQEAELIVRGAPEALFSLCKNVSESFKHHIEQLNKDGVRVIVVASRKMEKQKEYTWEDAKHLTLEGYIGFVDIPKKSAKDALAKLNDLHVQIKILTGDNALVTKKICEEVGLAIDNVLTGDEIAKFSQHELAEQIGKTTVFAKLIPSQKLEIIQLLRSQGHAVGYLGDGVNDLPALHGADVGLSVNTAVDVAKDAAQIVLLRRSLDVIADGIKEGRKTFQNTIKYILMATSSNFGNMFSAAGASFFLSFLPMTPVQILLTNGMYDLSQTTIPSDNVDAESLLRPRHFDIKFLKNYMLFFGPISSLFDFLTFGIMLFIFHARTSMFQTGWFVESIATEILVIFVIRTSRTPFFKSRPSIWLLGAALLIVGTGLVLPFSPLAKDLGFVLLPPLYFIVLLLLVGLYLTIVEFVKNFFLKKYSL